MFTTPTAAAVWVALAIVVIDLWSMRSTGPWDPWETHYGEVARQILVRSDPLDLWWQPGNGGPDMESEKSFASKPALPFWAMALSMRIFGIGTSADPSEMVTSPWAELALRLPSMLAGWTAALFLGALAWRLASPRAGVLTGAAVATMPQFAIVTRQALTDMFFVAPVVFAVGAWALAWLQPDRELATRGRGIKRIPWDRAYLGFLVVFVVLAIGPLAVLHQHAFSPTAWRYFGKIARRAQGLRDIGQQMFIYWALAAFVLVASLRWRRRSQAWMGILYLCAGASLIGKGLIGPGLVGVFVLAHLALSGRWSLLLRCGLPTGIAMFVLVAFPWHHAMALYRGETWVSELVIQNNLQRFGTGEQKQAVGGFTYYLETLGIAALPWSALAPWATIAGLRSFGRDPNEPGVELQRLAVAWLAVSLFVIGYSTTKYLHYLLPCLPPLALLVGLELDQAASRPGRAFTRWIGLLVGVGVLVVVIRDALNAPAWIAHLTTYLYTGMWTEGAPTVKALAITCAPFAVALALWPWLGGLRAAAICVLSGVLTTGWVVDDYLPSTSESWSQRSAMRIYFAERGPEDRLVSWWFYYRGETYFSKADLWVMKDPDRQAIADLVEESRDRGVTLWFVTTVQHANRLAPQLPADVRGNVEQVYESFHYALLRVRVL